MPRSGDRVERPVLELPTTPFQLSCEILAALGLSLLLLITLLAWPTLPERVPQHFGPSGLPDAWGGKGIVFLLPGIGAGLYLMFTLLAHRPHTYNYPVRITTENAERQYQIARSLMICVKAEVVWLFLVIQRGLLGTAFGQVNGLGLTPLWFVALLLGTVAIYLMQALANR